MTSMLSIVPLGQMGLKRLIKGKNRIRVVSLGMFLFVFCLMSVILFVVSSSKVISWRH